MQNPNPKWQKHRDRKGKGECAHLRETGGDLGPEGVDQVVEVGESVKLQREMWLVQHRKHPTRGAHQSRRHDFAKRSGIRIAKVRVRVRVCVLGLNRIGDLRRGKE